MHMCSGRLLPCLVVWLALAVVRADDEPETVKVEKKPFKIQLEMQGVFEADRLTPIAVRLDAWAPQSGGGQLTITEVVEHGKSVKKGDLLIQLDVQKLDEAIRDLEAESHLADLAVKQAEVTLPALEKSTPLKLAIAEKKKKEADENRRRFLEIDRPFSTEAAHFQVKNIRDFLDYEREELRQLEKMYKADDLTEETEEIILKRQRNTIEMVTFMLRSAEKERDRALQLELPRTDRELQDAAEQHTLELDEARSSLPLAVQEARLQLAKHRYERQKSTERLARLQRDRAALSVRAPVDGIVYYGRCQRGKWSTGESDDRLIVGGSLQPDDIVMTIASGALFVRAAVEEEQLRHLTLGQACRVEPARSSKLRLSGKLATLKLVPVKESTFDARVAIDPTEDTRQTAFFPGMTAKVKFVPYVNMAALALPASAVFNDELDETKRFVYLPGAKHERRTVTVGEETDDEVEIRQGLREGEEVLAEKPGAKGSHPKGDKAKDDADKPDEKPAKPAKSK